MGVVWLVEDHELEERVVIKLVPSDAPAEWVALLKRECRNARRLVHPNIVRVYDLHYEDPHRFISMEYVEGDDLIDMIKEDLVAERIAIDSYREMIEYIGDKDTTTTRMLEGILAMEEQHADDLVGMLEELDR